MGGSGVKVTALLILMSMLLRHKVIMRHIWKSTHLPHSLKVTIIHLTAPGFPTTSSGTWACYLISLCLSSLQSVPHRVVMRMIWINIYKVLQAGLAHGTWFGLNKCNLHNSFHHPTLWWAYCPNDPTKLAPKVATIPVRLLQELPDENEKKLPKRTQNRCTTVTHTGQPE